MADKRVVLLEDREVSTPRFRVVQWASVITARNIAQDVVQALTESAVATRFVPKAKANAFADRVAERQIATRFDDGGLGERAMRMWKDSDNLAAEPILVWFENAGPLADPVMYPADHKVFEGARRRLEKKYRVEFESLNAAISYFLLTPKVVASSSGRSRSCGCSHGRAGRLAGRTGAVPKTRNDRLKLAGFSDREIARIVRGK